MTNGTPPAIDRELLGLLERAFARQAGKATHIDAIQFQQALGLQSEYLAQRVFSLFDRDASGTIERDEFLQGVERLMLGSTRDKLWFAFRLHDHNGDGFLDPTEMLRMISMSMAESGIAERITQPAEYLTRVLFQATDTNHDGRISFDEFVKAVESRPELLRQMTRAQAIWLTPNEELLSLIDKGDHRKQEPAVRRLIGNGWGPVMVVICWVLANAALFTGVLLNAPQAPGQNPLVQVGGALAHCLDLNGALLLFPMLRRSVTWLRETWVGRLLPVDHAVAFHRLLGHSMFAIAIAHTVCFTLAYLDGHAQSGIAQLLTGTVIGASGLSLLVVFAIMWGCSLPFVRRTKRFELFYFTHLLYWLWFVLVIVHSPRFLLWAGVPLLGFVVETVQRKFQRAPASQVVKCEALRSGVTKLEIERPKGFVFNPADYVFLRIPAIAKHEWHPFTLSSAPENGNLTVHVRALGNWSRALRQLAERTEQQPLKAYVDGPYGSPSSHIFESRVAVLIGAGIGVTPFASVLESLVLRANRLSRLPSKLEKVHFFWLNRDQYSFEWFSSLLARLEGLDQHGMLDIHLCMTGAHAGATAIGLELARAAMQSSGRSDLITGLHVHTHTGQPDWDSLMRGVAEQHGTVPIDVYYCGPPGLGARIARICTRKWMSFREEKF